VYCKHGIVTSSFYAVNGQLKYCQKCCILWTGRRPEDDCPLAVGREELLGINSQSNSSSSLLHGVVWRRPNWKQANQVLPVILVIA